MSLVNDVLRQLDDRQTTPVHSMPLQSLQVPQTVQSKVSLQKILIFVGLALGIILIVQLVSQKPLNHLFHNQDNINLPQVSSLISDESLLVEDEHFAAELTKPKITLSKASSSTIQEVETVAVTSAEGNEISTIVELDPIELQGKPLAKERSSRIVGSNNDITKLKQSVNRVEKPIEFSTKIKKVEVPGLKQYQLALKAYKKKQSTIAMNWIDQAIEKGFDEKYSILKARIFIQKKSADDLFQYVLSQDKNSSLDWFKLVAPGLQMFGFYQLSNQYYTQLVNQQPKQAKWQLAMALNYSRLGLDNETYAIYKTLAASPVLSGQQKKWVLAKLNRMELDKVAINGS